MDHNFYIYQKYPMDHKFTSLCVESLNQTGYYLVPPLPDGVRGLRDVTLTPYKSKQSEQLYTEYYQY